MTDSRYSLLAAANALRYAMLQANLPTEGLQIVLPDDAYDHELRELDLRHRGFTVQDATLGGPGFMLMGVRILPASAVSVAG